MEYHKITVSNILHELGTGLTGLTESDAAGRIELHGPNELLQKKKVSPLKIFLSQFNSFIVYILAAAVAVSFMLDEFIDSIVIMIILIMNAVLGFVQEYRAERAIDSLKKMSGLQATVIRDNKKIRISSSDLVPGDIITFESGDKIPADARIINSSKLEVMEAMLTGESLPVKKESDIIETSGSLGDMKNMLFSGTSVVGGAGTAVVVRTGMETEIGKIAESLESVEEDQTPLQKNLNIFGRRLGFLTILICIIVIALGILKGGDLLQMVMVGVSLAVAAVPEGLPIVVTIALAMGVQKMVKNKALMKRLYAVETLGCTTVICTDKTGTLTKNEMTVTNLYLYDRIIDVTGTGYSTEGSFLYNDETVKTEELEKLLRIGVLNNDAALGSDKTIIGDPTEGALLVSGGKAGMAQDDYKGKYPRTEELPFDSERKMKSTVHKVDGKLLLYTKGAPDMLLKRCSRIEIDGDVTELTEDHRIKILGVNNSFADNAIRVLAFAWKEIDTFESIDDLTEEDLVFVGLQGMIDPPREEVKDAISICRKAKIRPVMITGDFSKTAHAIAKELGIEGDVMSGQELDHLNEEELSSIVKRVSIFARVNPVHKIKIVRSLRKSGEVVAMTGDGVNDAPAIKEADIGIAMGITGTDVSKDTADMILMDDKFTSIIHAVKQGRGIYENIKKFINYLLSSNLGEVLILFAAMIIGFTDNATGAIAMPLLATQILWLNLVTDGLPAVAMGVDPIRESVMDLPPRDPKERIVTLSMGVNIVIISSMMAGAVLFLFNMFLPEGGDIARTVSFTSIVLFEMVRIAMIRSQYKISFFSNPYLIGAVAISILLQVGVVYIPVLNSIFKTVPLGFIHWQYIGIMMAVLFVSGMVMVKIVNRVMKSE